MPKVILHTFKINFFAFFIAVSLCANSMATTAPSRFSTGHITYSSNYLNVGNYSGLLSSAVQNWNIQFSQYGYSNCVSLSNVPTGANVIVSFTSTYNDPSVLGRVSLWAYDVYGNGYQVQLSDGTPWVYGFLYVYPSSIAAEIAQSCDFNTSDLSSCILKTTVHEFGHILGLMHPTDNPQESIMKQGLSCTTTPSAYDMADIAALWT